METTVSFDLNRAIQQWCENLAQSPAVCKENVHELESHMRDSVATLQTRGLSAEEAFIVATRRVGTVGALEVEFAKVNRRAVWVERALWMLIGVQIWGFVMGTTGPVVRNALSWAWANVNYNYKENGVAIPVALFSFMQVLVLASSLLLCWWLVIRKGEKLSSWLTPLLLRRSTLVITGAGLCLLSLITYSFNIGLQALMIRAIGATTYSSTVMYLSYAHSITSPIQLVAMIVLTLVLARKRQIVRQAFDQPNRSIRTSFGGVITPG